MQPKTINRAPVPVSDTFIHVNNVGVKYRFLTERQTTLKGRLFGFLRRETAATSEFWALRGVDLNAAPGDVIGLIGPNGAGKSTLLRVLAGILRPAEGSVESKGKIRPLLDVMGTLNVDLTGRQNCFSYGALYRIPKSEVTNAVARIEEFSELQAFFDVPVKCYSSGMMARLGFALAVQFQPEILLIDEVLAVGDEHFQKKSYFKMLKLIERGTIVVVSSHNLAFVEQVCSKAVLMANGSIHGSGRPADIVREYRALSR